MQRSATLPADRLLQHRERSCLEVRVDHRPEPSLHDRANIPSISKGSDRIAFAEREAFRVEVVRLLPLVVERPQLLAELAQVRGGRCPEAEPGASAVAGEPSSYLGEVGWRLRDRLRDSGDAGVPRARRDSRQVASRPQRGTRQQSRRTASQPGSVERSAWCAAAVRHRRFGTTSKPASASQAAARAASQAAHW